MIGARLFFPRVATVICATWCLVGRESPGAVSLMPADSRPLQFARDEIERAVKDSGSKTPDVCLAISPATDRCAQSYRIERAADGTIRVSGDDARGAMYGGLDIAEAIRLATLDRVPVGQRRPFIQERGIKFNIPLDLRTPSYSDNSDAAQANIPEMWSSDFWRTMLDEMARHRYNALTLWNLHPFPSIVQVPEFPEVALNDVLRAKLGSFDERFSHSGRDMFRPKLLDGAEVVKRLSIRDKIAFWREVMQHARDRGIDVYWFTWNAFLFGAEGKHGLKRQGMGEDEVRYFRASVRETVRTYPLLAGIGITAGEYLDEPLAGRDKETWLWDTYGAGIGEALRDEPRREFRLIHRFHQTNAAQIRAHWQSYPSRFELSYKYAVAHMYSIPNPPFIREVLGELGGGLRTWLTVRNDDIYSFCWGDPEFARAFVKAIPPADKVCGFYMGPDGYIWGRDFLTKAPAGPRPTVIEKQWYSFLLWGRLAYDPDLPDEHFRRVLAHRFPQVDAAELDRAWRAASRIFPLITRFIWGSIDLRWFPEACLSHPNYRGFHTVREFIERDPMPGSGVLGIKAWRRAKLDGRAMTDTTPLELADQLAGQARVVRESLPALRRQSGFHAELTATLDDLEMFAQLGDYYAAKVRAACDLALFDATADERLRRSAVQHLETALTHWQAYAETYAARYQQRVLYNRVGWVDRTALIENVRADIELARQWKPGSQPGDRPKNPANPRAD